MYVWSTISFKRVAQRRAIIESPVPESWATATHIQFVGQGHKLDLGQERRITWSNLLISGVNSDGP